MVLHMKLLVILLDREPVTTVGLAALVGLDLHHFVFDRLERGVTLDSPCCRVDG